MQQKIQITILLLCQQNIKYVKKRQYDVSTFLSSKLYVCKLHSSGQKTYWPWQSPITAVP